MNDRFKITQKFKSAEKDRKFSYLNKLAVIIGSDLERKVESGFEGEYRRDLLPPEQGGSG